MSQEQPQLELLVFKLKESNHTEMEIIEVLMGIIKSQMITGGTLEDKINYHIHLAQKDIDRSHCK